MMLEYLNIPCITGEGWDTLPEVKFWRKVISTDKDSSVANVFATRQVLELLPQKDIERYTRTELDSLRKVLAIKYGLPEDTRILFTSGKKWFYTYDNVSLKMGRALQIFDSLGVDPFYAQMVLLIESPASNRARSHAGAYGNFQLMPFVARSYGLTVTKYVDERENFDRSAYAAAMLIKNVCVPYARQWCNDRNFSVDERATWFKLLALHNYNAGAYTVKSAMYALPPATAEKEIIKTMWHTSAGNFRNEAQNYSQLALACYLEYEQFMQKHKQVDSKIYDRF